MPLYEFTCPQCENKTEELQSFDAPAPTCSGLGSDKHNQEDMIKSLSATAFRLLGAGFYAPSICQEKLHK